MKCLIIKQEGLNLDVSRYRNGDVIPQVTDPGQWSTLTTGAWCYIENSTVNGTIYGKLYNCYAVNDPRGLAPSGWHVPTIDDWNILQTCLTPDAGAKMKSTGTIEDGTGLWHTPYTGNNSSLFTALPGASRSEDGSFWPLGYGAGFWSATENTSSTVYLIGLESNSPLMSGMINVKKLGLSVRCVKD